MRTGSAKVHFETILGPDFTWSGYMFLNLAVLTWSYSFSVDMACTLPETGPTRAQRADRAGTNE
eukprot:4650700-Prymnesium_polylepis.1